MILLLPLCLDLSFIKFCLTPFHTLSRLMEGLGRGVGGGDKGDEEEEEEEEEG